VARHHGFVQTISIESSKSMTHQSLLSLLWGEHLHHGIGFVGMNKGKASSAHPSSPQLAG